MKNMESPPQKLSLSFFISLSYGIFFLSNSLAIAMSSFLYPWTRTAEDQAYLIQAFEFVPKWSFLVYFGVPTFFVTLYVMPVLVAVKKQQVTPAAQLVILDAPLVVSIIGVIGWFLSFGSYLVGVYLSDMILALRPSFIFLADMFITGSLCFVITFYAFEFLSRKYFLPFFFPDNIVSISRAKRNLTTRARFLIYFFAVGVFPIFVFLRVTKSLSHRLEEEFSMIPMLMIAIIILSMGLLLSYLIGKSYEIPLKKMKTMVEHIMNGEYSTQVPVLSKDEIGLLGEGLNRMAVELDEKQSIVKSIQYAKMIQSSILPQWDLLKNYFADSFVIWKPRDIVAGDFVYFRQFQNSALIGVMDCTGHGVPGAFMTMLVSSGIRRITIDESVTDPAKILNKLNAYVKTSLHQDTRYSFSDDGLDASFCLIEPAQNRLTFAGAKMQMIYVNEGNIHYLKGDRQSLGYKKSHLQFEYTNQEIPLTDKTSFYLFSDGYMDQIGGSKRIRFGRNRFEQMILSFQQENLPTQKDMILSTFEDYRGEELVKDDITIVGFKAPK